MNKISILSLIMYFITTIFFILSKKVAISIIWGITTVLQLIVVMREYRFKEKIYLDSEEMKRLNAELKELISQNKINKAISIYRNYTGVGLKEAKEYIDNIKGE